jgi:hypothetical protein
VLKKPNRKSDEDDAPDVPADNPVGTMARFSEGLKRVLAVPKPRKYSQTARHRPRKKPYKSVI